MLHHTHPSSSQAGVVAQQYILPKIPVSLTRSETPPWLVRKKNLSLTRPGGGLQVRGNRILEQFPNRNRGCARAWNPGINWVPHQRLAAATLLPLHFPSSAGTSPPVKKVESMKTSIGRFSLRVERHFFPAWPARPPLFCSEAAVSFPFSESAIPTTSVSLIHYRPRRSLSRTTALPECRSAKGYLQSHHTGSYLNR